MSGNKNSSGFRYLKYALGEILLVIIGILIALSINNWNEDRKDRIYERNMLNEIKVALEEDIAFFTRCQKRYEKLDSAATAMIHLIDQKADFIDSMYNKTSGRGRWYNLRTGIIYNYNRGPYESLKSAGLDKLKDDALRNELVNVYDSEFIYLEKFFDYFEQDYRMQGETLEDFLGEPMVVNIDGKKSITAKLPKDLLRNPEFINLVNDIQYRGDTELGIITVLNKKLISLKSHIDSVLNKE
jgi:hypothetical protein